MIRRFWNRLFDAVQELGRLKDRPEHVARGFAIGMGLGVSPFWGLLTPVGIFCCWLTGGTQAAGMIGMWAIAPLLYVIVFPLEIWIGSLLLGVPPAYTIIDDLMRTMDFSLLWAIGKSWVVGFFPVGLLTAALCYSLSLNLLRRLKSDSPATGASLAAGSKPDFRPE